MMMYLNKYAYDIVAGQLLSSLGLEVVRQKEPSVCSANPKLGPGNYVAQSFGNHSLGKALCFHGHDGNPRRDDTN